MALLVPRRLAAMAILGTTAACERVVPIALDDRTPQLVVEGRIGLPANGGVATQVVRLTQSQTRNFTQPGPPATGAVVRMRDNAGRIYNFEERPTGSGVFVGVSPAPVGATTLTLQITWEGDRYEATDHIPAAVPIDSVAFIPGEGSPPGTHELTIFLTDPPGAANHYDWVAFDGNSLLLARDTVSVVFATSDSTFNGFQHRVQPFRFLGLRRNATVRVRQASLSRFAGRFGGDVMAQSRADGSVFSAAPFNIRGNVLNLTTPSRRGLGFFAAATEWETVVITP